MVIARVWIPPVPSQRGGPSQLLDGGLHGFIVPLRKLTSGEPAPGISLGMCEDDDVVFATTLKCSSHGYVESQPDLSHSVSVSLCLFSSLSLSLYIYIYIYIYI